MFPADYNFRSRLAEFAIDWLVLVLRGIIPYLAVVVHGVALHFPRAGVSCVCWLCTNKPANVAAASVATARNHVY